MRRSSRLWWLLPLLVLGAVGVGWWAKPTPGGPQGNPADETVRRSYTATAQVLSVRARPGGGCGLQVRLHSWSSLSNGFALAEIPQKGQLYTLRAAPQHCMALEVALAAQGDPEDLKSPRHIYYKAGQVRSGEWVLLEAPKAPQGCGGL